MAGDGVVMAGDGQSALTRPPQHHTDPSAGGVLVNGSVAMAGDRVIIRACHGGFLDFLTMYSALTMAKQFYF